MSRSHTAGGKHRTPAQRGSCEAAGIPIRAWQPQSEKCELKGRRLIADIENSGPCISGCAKASLLPYTIWALAAVSLSAWMVWFSCTGIANYRSSKAWQRHTLPTEVEPQSTWLRTQEPGGRCREAATGTDSTAKLLRQASRQQAAVAGQYLRGRTQIISQCG